MTTLNPEFEGNILVALIKEKILTIYFIMLVIGLFIYSLFSKHSFTEILDIQLEKGGGD